MKWVRMPESIANSLAREVNIIGPKCPIRDNDKQAGSIKQQHFSLKGNKCGHDKNNPIFFAHPTTHRRRPPILEKSKRELAKLYFNPLSQNAGQMSYNPHSKNKNGGYRKVRSELRNLINKCVGECLLHYLDLKTMYVGYEISGVFHHFGIDFIYRAIKESLITQQRQETITYERVRKTIKIFEECGYLFIEHEKAMRIDGTFYSKPAKLRFNRAFFTDLGLDEESLYQSLKDEEKRLNSDILKKKAIEYAHEKRQGKKAHKKEMRSVMQLLNAKRAGHKLNEDEREFLNQEYPGLDRQREPEKPLYPEYISKLIKRPPS